MNKITRILLSAALLSLTACSPLVYGKVETPSIQDKETFPNLPGGAPDLSVVGLLTATFDVGDIFGFDLTSSEMKDSSIKLNGATLKLASSAPAGAKLDKVTSAVIQIGTPPKPIASFEARAGKAPAGSLSADGTTITFATLGDEELFSYLKNKTVQVVVSATGAGPGAVGSTWTADLVLDFKVVAQYNAL